MWNIGVMKDKGHLLLNDLYACAWRIKKNLMRLMHPRHHTRTHGMEENLSGACVFRYTIIYDAQKSNMVREPGCVLAGVSRFNAIFS